MVLESVALTSGLVYHRAGTEGTPLVLINALGQDLRPWAGLIERLLPQRVLTWRLRGLPPDAAVRFDDHVDDLAEVLAAESVRSAHLVGWCTGPKTALAFAKRFPDRVRSVVALSPSFKHPGRSAELDTPYERNLAVLCRSVTRRPESAGRLREMFQPAGATGQDNAVRQAFGSAAALVAYARQHQEFWAATVEPVAHPVLFIMAGKDEVVSPDAVRAGAVGFPRRSCVELRDAGHHALVEQADQVAGLLQGFTLAHEH